MSKTGQGSVENLATGAGVVPDRLPGRLGQLCLGG